VNTIKKPLEGQQQCTLTSNDGVRAEVRCSGGVVHQVLDDEVAVAVDEGHEGGGVERLVVEVEGTDEGQRGGHQREHPESAPVQPGHCKQSCMTTHTNLITAHAFSCDEMLKF
jgi:hypothetical protein